MENIQKPTIVVNESKCRQNIRQMAEKARKSSVIFRPHFKTHNSLKVGKWFKDEGVKKITVSSLSMAKFFAEDGWKDIMVAFPFNQREIHLLNELSENTNISILLAGNEPLPILTKKLKNNIDFYVKIDVGSKRAGYLPDSVVRIEKMLDLADMNQKLQFCGFVAHAGHTYQAKSFDEIKSIYNDSVKKLQSLKNYFSRRYQKLIISWGDTPSCKVIENFSDVDEIRPGSFVYNDLMQLEAGICNIEDIAVAVAAPVVAKYIDRHELVVYGGAVHLSKEFVTDNKSTVWGRVVFFNKEGWSFPKQPTFVKNIYQEHGIIKLQAEDFFSVEVGDLIGIIPVHACLTAYHLKDNYYYI